jgi:hypothetical protein
VGVGARGDGGRSEKAVEHFKLLFQVVARVLRPGENYGSNLARRNDRIDEVVWFTRDVVADLLSEVLRSC